MKGSRSARFISDKIDFRAHKTIRDWEKNYMIVKESIHSEVTAIVHVYAPNTRAAKYVRQKLRAERRNRQIHNYNRRLHCPSLNILSE